jgi:predicted MFS family arabinose efflux permease
VVRENNPATADNGPLGAGISRSCVAFAGVAMLLLAAILSRALPKVPATERLRYPALLRSVLELVKSEPLLRQRMVLGATAFGCFSVLWTSLAFLLSGPQYHYGNTAIGLFGLAGLAGAVAAPVAGRLADRGHGRLAMSAAILVLLASWGLLAFGKSSVVALIGGIAALDLGAATAAVGLVTWLVSGRAMSGRLPIGADSAA